MIQTQAVSCYLKCTEQFSPGRYKPTKEGLDAMANNRKIILVGGASLLVIGVVGAWKYSSAIRPESTQGAIGQREVYRDTATKASDVAVTPGSAPVAEQVNAAAIKSKALEANITSDMKAKIFDNYATSEMKAKVLETNVTSEMKAKIFDNYATSEMKAKAIQSNFDTAMKAKMFDNAATSEMKANAIATYVTSDMKAKVFDAFATSEMKSKALNMSFNSDLKSKAQDLAARQK
jgi:hypothetical protein